MAADRVDHWQATVCEPTAHGASVNVDLLGELARLQQGRHVGDPPFWAAPQRHEYATQVQGAQRQKLVTGLEVRANTTR